MHASTPPRLFRGVLAVALVVHTRCAIEAAEHLAEPFIPGLSQAIDAVPPAFVQIGVIRDGGSTNVPHVLHEPLVQRQIETLEVLGGTPRAIAFESHPATAHVLPSVPGYGWDLIPPPDPGTIVLAVSNPSGGLWTSPERVCQWEITYGIARLPDAQKEMIDTIQIACAERLADSMDTAVGRAFDPGNSEWKRFLAIDRLLHHVEAWPTVSAEHWSQVGRWSTDPHRSVRIRSYFLWVVSQHQLALPDSLLPSILPIATESFVRSDDHGLPRYYGVRLLGDIWSRIGSKLKESERSEILAQLSNNSLIPSGNRIDEATNPDGTLLLGYDDHAEMARAMHHATEQIQFSVK